MYKNVLASIPGIELYPIVALVFFFGFFVGLLVWFLRVDRTRLEAIANSALDDGNAIEQPSLRTNQRNAQG